MHNMEWSKDKTLKLIELLQVNPYLWNPSLCDTRRDKQKRKEELREIAESLSISVGDTTKKIQHLRTQYNRESARESRANTDEPNDRYVSNWYAYEYLHFMKDSSKPYRLIEPGSQLEISSGGQININNSTLECKLSPPHKIARSDSNSSVKPEALYPTSPRSNRDEFSVFGEYVANELRSLKGEKNQLVAKKKIQDAIFEVKMGLIDESRNEACNVRVYTHTTPHNASLHNGKLYTTPVMSTTAHIEPLTATHTPPSSQISEIIINTDCHYSNFKVDNQ